MNHQNFRFDFRPHGHRLCAAQYTTTALGNGFKDYMQIENKRAPPSDYTKYR